MWLQVGRDIRLRDCWTTAGTLQRLLDGKAKYTRAWVNANFVSIYRRNGSRSEPSSYRPFFIDIIGKLFVSMVVGRPKRTVTTNYLKTLCIPVRESLARRHPDDLVFVDINKAFKCVQHWAIFKLIQQVGASENNQSSIKQHDEPRETIQGSTIHFTYKRGVQLFFEGFLSVNAVRSPSSQSPVLRILTARALVCVHSNTNKACIHSPYWE